MTKPRRIYLLSPKDLTPETIAVTFAKTSRSPKPFDEIAAELTDERSAQFHEKWVVGYGHASVAEHAVLHLALENVSRLAIETIEGNRLASYTEKSTRYQQWDRDAFFTPSELDGHDLQTRYDETCRVLFQTYQDCLDIVQSYLGQTTPKQDGESTRAYQRRLQSASIDVCRFLLPSASLANVGITINARALEYAICKMLSSPLVEVREIGDQLRKVAKLETPTLIKYAACNQYLVATRGKAQVYSQSLELGKSDQDFRLISWNPNGEDEVLAALLFRFGDQLDYGTSLAHVQGLSPNEKAAWVEDLMGQRGPFDQPLREFEYAYLTFEVVMDQGAYFEFKRHRMMTQTVQTLSPKLGFAVPRAIVESGCDEIYASAMRSAADVYDQIAEVNPDAASYIIPNGFNRGVLFTMNLREAFNFVRLRAAENAHFSIRRVALRLVDAIRAVYPTLGKYLLISNDENWKEIENRYFLSTRSY